MRISLAPLRQQRLSLVVFLLEDELPLLQAELEKWGQQTRVKVVIQPCPFEGIEFLYRVGLEDLRNQETSVDKSLYWQALRVSDKMSAAVFNEFSQAHHDMLVSVIEQDASKIARCRKQLNVLLDEYSA